MKPQLKLYRDIRRLHRQLPPALKVLGNSYVRDEFSRHRNAGPQFQVEFLEAWTAYRDQLAQQVAENAKAKDAPMYGKKLDPSIAKNLNDQQLGQLYELYEATHAPSDTNGKSESNQK